MAWVNPRYRELTRQEPPKPPSSTATAPEPSGQLLATCARSKRDGPDEEFRVVLDEYEGHPYISLRLWVRSDAGWVPTKKGVSCRISEAQTVADALVTAAKLAGPKQARADSPARSKGRPSNPRQPELPTADRAPREDFDEFAESN